MFGEGVQIESRVQLQRQYVSPDSGDTTVYLTSPLSDPAIPVLTLGQCRDAELF